jgi:hypothetical protein
MPGRLKENDTLSIISSPDMVILLVVSIIAATANSILYKSALNAFSSPTSDYGFFVSQFSTLLYFFPASVVSLVLIWTDSDSWQNFKKIPQSVYGYMGILDSGSSILGTGMNSCVRLN